VLTAARSRLFLGITSTDTKEKTLYPEKKDTDIFADYKEKRHLFQVRRQWSGGTSLCDRVAPVKLRVNGHGFSRERMRGVLTSGRLYP
jgi:hypothetical protein